MKYIKISTPTTITPLSSQYVYIGSHFGDAQVIRILPDRSSSRGSYIEVVDAFTNVAPLMDTAVVDLNDKQVSFDYEILRHACLLLGSIPLSPVRVDRETGLSELYGTEQFSQKLHTSVISKTSPTSGV